MREDTDLFIIDEVGKMELYSSSFFPAVLQVLESNIPILASIPIPKYGRDIPEGELYQTFLSSLELLVFFLILIRCIYCLPILFVFLVNTAW